MVCRCFNSDTTFCGGMACKWKQQWGRAGEAIRSQQKSCAHGLLSSLQCLPRPLDASMNAGPGGFVGAPVSKALVFGTVVSSVFVQASHSWHSHLPAGLSAFAQLFVFKHPGVLIFGTALLYYFRCASMLLP